MYCWHGITFILLLIASLCGASLDIYYIDEICGSTVDLSEIYSCSVETSKSLTYPNNMDCAVSFTAPAGRRLFLQITRFVTELSDGQCFDYLHIYDGSSTTGSFLANQLCGELIGEPEYNTTASSVTFKFISDESAKDRGFAIFLLAFTPGSSCNEDELLCGSRDICIDSATSACDDFDHCGDGTDESSCEDGGVQKGNGLSSFIGLLVGVAVAGLVILIILICIIRMGYKKYKWNQYMKTLYDSKKLIATKKLEASYPLTHNYQDEEYVNVTRAQRDAAIVKINDNPAEDTDIPYGSSTSLAPSFHSENSVRDEKPSALDEPPQTNPNILSSSEPNEEPPPYQPSAESPADSAAHNAADDVTEKIADNEN